MLLWLGKRAKALFSTLLVVFAVCFLCFTRDYHGQAYRTRAAQVGFAGLLPAIDFAYRVASNRICITDAVNMPDIYVLFSQHLDPADYLPGIKYADVSHEFRKVILLGRYRFGLAHCPSDERIVYVLSVERPPRTDTVYTRTVFEGFTV